MGLSRRQFVRLCSLCAISAGFSTNIANHAFGQSRSRIPETAKSGFPIPFEAQRDPLFFMSMRTFTQHLETRFVIDPGYARPIEATLIEVKDTRTATSRKKDAQGQECFLLKFRIDSDKSVQQGTYQIRHDALGTFELFVVPTEDSEGRKYLDAVINRVIE